jgi:hypothetical protein
LTGRWAAADRQEDYSAAGQEDGQRVESEPARPPCHLSVWRRSCMPCSPFVSCHWCVPRHCYQIQVSEGRVRTSTNTAAASSRTIPVASRTGLRTPGPLPPPVRGAPLGMGAPPDGDVPAAVGVWAGAAAEPEPRSPGRADADAPRPAPEPGKPADAVWPAGPRESADHDGGVPGALDPGEEPRPAPGLTDVAGAAPRRPSPPPPTQ